MANALAMVTAFGLVERLGVGLHAAWTCMVGFQLVRLVVFGVQLTKRADVNVND